MMFDGPLKTTSYKTKINYIKPKDLVITLSLNLHINKLNIYIYIVGLYRKVLVLLFI